jgi:hypothetical protein
MTQWIHCCPFFSYFPLNRFLEWRARKRRRSHPRGVRLIQIRLYGFCEKGHYFVKTIRTDYQKALGMAG